MRVASLLVLWLDPARDEIHLLAAALRADQPLAPIEDRRIGAVQLREPDGIRLDLMATFSAPHDQSDLGRGRIAERHRRARLGLGPQLIALLERNDQNRVQLNARSVQCLPGHGAY